MNIIKDIAVSGSENKLMGTDVFYQDRDQKLPIVIYVHGFNGLKDWGNFDIIAKQFAEAGFFFIKMNLSHNGTTLDSPLEFTDLEAFGRNNYSKELFDVNCIIDWISSKDNNYANRVDISNIILLGHSRGGGIAILKASTDIRIKALITWASISECKTPWGNMSFDKMEKWKQEGVMYYHNKRTNQKMPLYYQLFEDYQQNEGHLNIQNAIKKLKIPILICHGLNDPAVNYSSAQSLQKWQPNAKLFTVDSDHVFGRSHPWILNELPPPMQSVVDVSIDFIGEAIN
jgi:dienelactone hydrolase